MKKLILKLADDINNGRIDDVEVKNIIKQYIGVSNHIHIPPWLSQEDIDIACAYYKSGKKLDSVKYICGIAKPYVEYPLKWSKEFMEKYMNE